MHVERTDDNSWPYKAHHTVEGVNKHFELFECMGTFLTLLQQEKYRVGRAYRMDWLFAEQIRTKRREGSLADLFLGMKVCDKLLYIEEIFYRGAGARSRAVLIVVTDAGKRWHQHYKETYEDRYAEWQATQNATAAEGDLAADDGPQGTAEIDQ